MKVIINIIVLCFIFGCTSNVTKESIPTPNEIIDLGALVSEELPEEVWGGLMKQYGFDESNSFEVINKEFEFEDGVLSVNNSYLTIFNHGGPHVDVPKHVNYEEGIDSYSVDDFIGPLKVIDVSNSSHGRTVTLSKIMEYDIRANDIVIIYTNYILPKVDEIPKQIALTQEAAAYLANLPVRAFGTDSYNVESNDNPTEVNSESALQRFAPIHYEFLSKGIPLYEQLFNVDKLLNKQNMLFIGQPLNIKGADGMIVRPVVFIYN